MRGGRGRGRGRGRGGGGGGTHTQGGMPSAADLFSATINESGEGGAAGFQAALKQDKPPPLFPPAYIRPFDLRDSRGTHAHTQFLLEKYEQLADWCARSPFNLDAPLKSSAEGAAAGDADGAAVGSKAFIAATNRRFLGFIDDTAHTPLFPKELVTMPEGLKARKRARRSKKDIDKIVRDLAARVEAAEGGEAGEVEDEEEEEKPAEEELLEEEEDEEDYNDYMDFMGRDDDNDDYDDNGDDGGGREAEY